MEQILHEEVIQSFYEKQDEIFVQVSEKYSCDNSVENDNLVAMSYEDDLQCFQISEDQRIEDCHLGFSCFEMLFQEDNNCLSKRKQKVLSPLFEDKIDQLLKSHVTAQANVGLQCSHGQEGVSEASSTFENEDSFEIRFVDQRIDIVFFHEGDRAVMFDNLEECFPFKNDLDYKIEEYEPDRDNMPEFESEFLMV